MNTSVTPFTAYLRVVRHGWRWVVWGVLIALAGTIIGLFLQPPAYRSDATVFVRTPGDVSRVVDGGDFYAQGRARTYAALASSPSLAARVAANLGYREQAATLADRITGNSPPGTALIHISVTAPSAADAQQTATVFLPEFAETVRELESVPGSLVPRAELVVVDPPSQGVREWLFGLPIPIVLLGVTLVGLVLGATAAVLRSSFQRRDNGSTPSQSNSIQASNREVIA